MSSNKCLKCDATLKKADLVFWEGQATFNVPYCPKCNEIPEVGFSQLHAFSGKAQRGINKTTGEFRLKVTYPEDFNKDIMVKTFPSYRTTKPSEWI